MDREQAVLIEQLERERVAGGWTHRQFADELGMSLRHWMAIKAGAERPGGVVLRRAVARFPQLLPAASLYLLEAGQREQASSR